MSMISAQIDELRERAKELRSLAPDPDVPYLVPSTKETMALAMRSAAGEMEDAADTIWQLRDDLQRANDAVQDAEHDESMAWDRVRKADAENRKLRNLIDGFMFCDSTNSASSDDCIGCPLHDQSPHNYRCTKEERMRELGVEVSDG